MNSVSIVATGMVTGVGLDAPSSCAAIRCAIDRFQETRFRDRNGEWIIGSEVPLSPPSRGREKILRLAAAAIAECVAAVPDVAAREIPLVLCVAEQTRAGRFEGLDQSLLGEIGQQLKMAVHGRSAVIVKGRVGGVEAIARASEMIRVGAPYSIVAGVDTFLVAPTLAFYEKKNRLLTSKNSNGFIPGEAAGALLIGPAGGGESVELRCLGIGFGQEKATIESEEPVRADGLVAALRAAMGDAGCGFEDVDYRLTDSNGEQYAFKEASLALARTVRVPKADFDIWHPADCIGEVGAATVPCALAVADAAARKLYAPGPGVLAHFGNDSGERAAMVLRYSDHGA